MLCKTPQSIPHFEADSPWLKGHKRGGGISLPFFSTFYNSGLGLGTVGVQIMQMDQCDITKIYSWYIQFKIYPKKLLYIKGNRLKPLQKQHNQLDCQ